MNYIDIVFEGEAPNLKFVEVENERGESVQVGEWVERPDGKWVLRIERSDMSDSNNGAMIITPEMIQSGVRALNDEIGYDHNGDPEYAVKAVFVAMLRKEHSNPPS